MLRQRQLTKSDGWVVSVSHSIELVWPLEWFLIPRDRDLNAIAEQIGYDRSGQMCDDRDITGPTTRFLHEQV
jgi:hypothetical protein